jgi:hypothetical protein
VRVACRQRHRLSGTAFVDVAASTTGPSRPCRSRRGLA